MKRLLIFWLFALMCTAGFSQTSWEDDFNDGATTGWMANSFFTLTAQDGQMEVDVLTRTKWQYITNNISSTDISANPVVNIRIKTLDLSAPFSLEVLLKDGSNTGKTVGWNLIYPSTDFVDYTIDFSTQTLDFTDIVRVGLAFNGASNGLGTKLAIDNISIGGTVKKANLPALSDMEFYQGTGPHVIQLPGISNASVLSLSSTSLIQDVSFSAIDANGLATMTLTLPSGVSGTETLTLTATGENGFSNNTSSFSFTLADNMAPTIDPVANQTVEKGKLQKIKLTGIGDGDKAANQLLDITVTTDAPDAIANPVIEYKNGWNYAWLKFTPSQVKENINMTITVDDGQTTNNTTEVSFTVNSYDGFNHLPQIEALDDFSIFLSGGAQTIDLTGISDGDGMAQNLSFVFTSSNETVLPLPTVTYTQGEGTAILNLDPQQIGSSNITLTISDDGDNGTNNGNESKTISFSIDVLADPVESFVFPLSDWATEKSWYSPNSNYTSIGLEDPDGNGNAIKLTYSNKSTWDGVWVDLPQELDLENYPYMSFKVMPMTQELDAHCYFYDLNRSRNAEGAHAEREYDMPVGVWTTVVMDFRGEGYLLDQYGDPININRITDIMFNLHDAFVWPFVAISGTLYIKDIKLGSATEFPVVTPTCTLNGTPDLAYLYDAGAVAQTINLSGITNGDYSSTGVSLSISSSNTAVANPVVGTVAGNGTSSFTFTPGIEGTSELIIQVSAAGSNNYYDTLMVSVVSADPANAEVLEVDLSTHYQTMRGFGTYRPNTKALIDPWYDDLGCSVTRFFIDGLEDINDNSDPNVLDMEALNYDAFEWDLLIAMKEKGLTNFITTVLSPPSWMKKNLSENWQGPGAITQYENAYNAVALHYFEEYAEYCVAICKVFEQEMGFELLAICVQNEPVYNEPYGSGILDPEHFALISGMVGQRFQEEGINTLIMGPEDVSYGSVYRMNTFVDGFQADNVADQHIKVIATHGYADDGITPGFPDYSDWVSLWNNTSEAPNPKELWMTETFHPYESWETSLGSAGALVGALEWGNVSEWSTYKFSDEYWNSSTNQPTGSFYTYKMFYSNIRPGAIRVKTTEVGGDNPDIIPTSFLNSPENGGNLVTLIINKGDAVASIKVNRTGGNVPVNYSVVQAKEYGSHINLGDFAADDLIVLAPRSVTAIIGYGTVYNLNVTEGSGTGEYGEGAVIEISANNAPVGKVFDTWTGDVSYVADVNSPSTTVTMPAANVSIVASYTDIPYYALTVNKGTGSGSFVEGAVITIAADDSTSQGKVFVGWTGDVAYLANAADSMTTVTIPAQAVNVTATYADAGNVVKHSLVVTNGAGSGTYVEGANVTITANAPSTSDKIFDKWIGTGISYLVDVNASSTILTIPTMDVSVEATYKDITKYTLTLTSGTIQGASGDSTGLFKPGEIIKINANTAPAGQIFSEWSGDISSLDNKDSRSAELTMPESNVSLTALFEEVITYNVIVNNGNGQQIIPKTEGANVTIIADSTWDGIFDNWTGDLSKVGITGDSKSLSFVMPAEDLEFTVHYSSIQGKLVFTITDKEDNLLDNVLVEVTDNSSISTTSNTEGIASLDLDYGDYNLTISKEGYLTRTFNYRQELPLMELPFVLSKSSVGIENIVSANGLHVYPNPANSIVNISLNNETIINQVDIYDLSGKSIQSIDNLNLSNVSISILDIQEGTYILKVSSPSGKYTSKLIIN